MTLSILLELPCDTFLAELVAVCFPECAFENNLHLNAKMSRLISKLRSVADTRPTGSSQDHLEPLSARYQAKSQRVLASIGNASVCQFGEFKETTEPGPGEPVNLAQGSYSFEHDKEYLSFLDTLFAVICPVDETASVHGHLAHSSHLAGPFTTQGLTPYPRPCLDSYRSLVSNSDPSLSCWKQLLPLLSALSEWSKTSPQSQRQELNISDAKTRRESKPKSPRVGPTLRVEVPIPLLINCLRVREDERIENLPDKPTKSKLCPSSTDEESVNDKGQSLQLSDLQEDLARESPVLETTAPVGEGNAGLDPTSVLTSLQPGHNGDCSITSISLLQVPEGTLQVSYLDHSSPRVHSVTETVF